MVKEKKVLEKHYREHSETIESALRHSGDAALITLGDPCTYSTAWPVLTLLKDHAPDKIGRAHV